MLATALGFVAVIGIAAFLAKTFLRLVVGAVAPAGRCTKCGATPRRDPANGNVYATCRKCGHVRTAPTKPAAGPTPFALAPLERQRVYQLRGTVDTGGLLTLTAQETKRIRDERAQAA